MNSCPHVTINQTSAKDENGDCKYEVYCEQYKKVVMDSADQDICLDSVYFICPLAIKP